MKKLKILGIYRNPKFSNNAIEADRLILEESLSQVERTVSSPLAIEMIEEDEASALSGAYDLVLTMAQAEQTLQTLDRLLGPTPAWNPQAAIRSCYRKTMSQLLGSMAVGYVPFRLLDTAAVAPEIAEGESYWLKRSDFHAISDEDVTLAESAEELRRKLGSFRSRGVSEVILQRHVHGDIYKFYGVRGKLFRAIKVRKFLESPPAPDLDALEKRSQAAAEALGLVVFGGDAILSQDGAFHLIDLNDWPSFRICREEAARAVGSLAADFLEESAPPKEHRELSPPATTHA